MNKYILFIFGFVICFNTIINAQVDSRDQWMNKYWFYRWRLVNDFMVVGNGPGYSLPANIRGGDEPSPLQGANWGLVNGVNTCNLDWGADGTSSLGWYVAVLASEWGCVKVYTLPTEPTGHCMDETGLELRDALLALERLDKHGESDQNVIMGYSALTDTLENGCLIRDDVPSNFVTANSAHFNSGKTISHLNPTFYSDVSTVSSAYSKAAASPANAQYLDMSKDQYVHIFMGLAMVLKFCSDTDNYAGYYFHEHAYNLIMAMITYFAAQDNPYSLIKQPPISGYVYSGNDNYYSDGDQDDLGPGFYMIAKKWAGLTGAAPSGNSSLHWLFDQALITAGIYTTYWYANPAQQAYMPGFLAACGNSFITGGLNFNWAKTSPDNYSNMKTTTDILYHMSYYWDYNILPLMHAVMYATDAGKYHDADFQSFLTEAPCYGPYNFGAQNWAAGSGGPQTTLLNVVNGYNNYHNRIDHVLETANYSYTDGFASAEWSSENRWYHSALISFEPGISTTPSHVYDPAQSDSIDLPLQQATGEYNGLDYMLYYNLYMFNYGNSNGSNEVPLTGFRNEISNYLNDDYPALISGVWVGNSSGNVKTNIGFQNIVSTEHISNGGYVFEQAGEEIDLNPGFEADAGSSYEAKIQYLSDCVGGGNTYQSPNQHTKLDTITALPAPQNSSSVALVKPDTNNTADNAAKPLNIVSVFPNPFSNDLNIEVQVASNGTFNFSLVNMLGQTVKQQVYTNNSGNSTFTVTLHYADLANGFYTVIVNDNQNISQKKIVKD